MTTPSTLTRLAAAILLPCHLASAAAAAEAEKYPIWWSPTLELESLDKIDERRRKRFWPEEYEGMDVFKDGDSKAKSAVVENCVSLDRLLNEGFYPPFSRGSQIAMSLSATCTTLDMLESARAAEVSFVRDFVMTAEALDYLPAMVNIAPGYDWMCRQYRANERRIPLSRFEAERNVQLKVLNDFKIEGRIEWWFYDVEILARADFNRDGLEDLLVIASADATEGTWAATTIFLLNRDTPDGVLWVVDAEEELCTNYRPCDAHYDEPAALR